MEIREFREGDVLVLAPEGSIAGTEETSMIETKLGTVLKTGFRLLVLDCTGVGQLTGPAIRVLLMTSRKLERVEGRLVLCAMGVKVKKAFSISGFDKDFVVVPTREEALRRVLEPLPPRPRAQARKPAPKEVARVEPVAMTPAAEAPPPVPMPAVAAPAPAVEAPPAVAAAPPPAAVAPPPAAVAPSPAATAPPAPDIREALADSLLEAMGVDIDRFEPAELVSDRASDREALAGALLEAMHAGLS